MSKICNKDSLQRHISGGDIFDSTDRRLREYRNKWGTNPKNLDPGQFPIHIDIEVTNICNLKCPFCATTYLSPKLKRGFIKWEIVKRVIDEAGREGAYSVKFNMRGEPLLHKELGRFINYAKKKGIIDTFFNTNATLLTEEKSRMLIDSGLDRITVSFEGFSKEMYEENRIGAKFERVVANIERLRNLRDKAGVSKPKIRVQAVLIPTLKKHINEFISFWKDKVDQVSYNEMLDNIPGNIAPVKSSWICPFLYQRIMIMWDGIVTACYNDFYGQLSMGNINSTTLKECWIYSLQDLRMAHRQGQAHEIEVCARCPLRISEINKLRRKIINE